MLEGWLVEAGQFSICVCLCRRWKMMLMFVVLSCSEVSVAVGGDVDHVSLAPRGGVLRIYVDAGLGRRDLGVHLKEGLLFKRSICSLAG